MYHGQDLYKAGIDYHATGSIKHGRRITAYYYKLSNGITPEQLQTIRETHPQAHTGHTRAQYAPELTCKVLIIPSKAEMKRQRMAGFNCFSGLTNNGGRAL